MAWLGGAWRGLAWSNTNGWNGWDGAGPGSAWRGRARRGGVWLGGARQGMEQYLERKMARTPKGAGHLRPDSDSPAPKDQLPVGRVQANGQVRAPISPSMATLQAL